MFVCIYFEYVKQYSRVVFDYLSLEIYTHVSVVTLKTALSNQFYNRTISPVTSFSLPILHWLSIRSINVEYWHAIIGMLP